MNRTDDALSFALRIDGGEAAAALPARSIATFIGAVPNERSEPLSSSQ